MGRITLKTADGNRMPLVLDHFSAGVDPIFRRWIREPDGWQCVETGEIAHETRLWSRKLLDWFLRPKHMQQPFPRAARGTFSAPKSRV